MVHPVVTGIDDDLSGSSMQPLTVSTSQKQLTLTLKSTDSMEKRKAEIVWALKCVVCDYWANSAEHIPKLFKALFSDSQIASEFQTSCNKITYLINFGVALYFWQILVEEINFWSFFIMSFDDSLNKVTQTS